MSRTWQRIVVGLVAVALVAAATAQAGEAVVLGRVCIRDVKQLVEKATKVVDKIVPGQGAQMKVMADMQLQGAQFAGADWSRPVSIVLISGKGFGKVEPVPVGIIPVVNGEQFRQARQAAGQVGEKIEIRGNYALISNDPGAFAAISEERINIYSSFPKAGGDADVYLTFQIDDSVKEYQIEIDQAMQQAQEQVAGMGAAGGPFAMMGQIQKAMGPIAKFAATQASRVSLILKLTDDSLEIMGRFYAIEGSHLATALAGQPQTKTDLAKYLPPDACMSFVTMSDITKARPFAEALLDTLATPLEMKTEDRDKVLALMFGSTQTGEAAIAYSGDPAHKGMQMAQVLRIADAAKFRAASKDAVEWMMRGPLGGMLQGMGMNMDVKHEPGIREHKGVTIDRLTVTVKQDPNAQPNPMMGQQQPQLTEMGALDDLGVAATNNPTGELLNAVIDRIKGGEPGLDRSPAYKAALAAAPKNASIVYHVSFNTFIAKMLEEIAKQQPMVAMMAGGIAQADPNEPPITGYAIFDGNRVEFSTRVPQQPIINLANRIRKMMEQRGGPGAAPGPRPGGVDDF